MVTSLILIWLLWRSGTLNYTIKGLLGGITLDTSGFTFIWGLSTWESSGGSSCSWLLPTGDLDKESGMQPQPKILELLCGPQNGKLEGRGKQAHWSQWFCLFWDVFFLSLVMQQGRGPVPHGVPSRSKAVQLVRATFQEGLRRGSGRGLRCEVHTVGKGRDLEKTEKSNYLE